MRRIPAYVIAGAATLGLGFAPSSNGQPGSLQPASPVAPAHIAGSLPSAWSAPELIPARDIGTPAPEYPPVFDAEGNAVLVWMAVKASFKEVFAVEYLVRTSIRLIGGTWQPPETLSHLGLNPAIAIDSSGNATAAWESPFGIQAATRPAGGSWLTPQTVAGPGEAPQVAADARGDVIIVANQQEPKHSRGIQAVLRAPREPFSPAQTISGPDNDFHPRIVMNARGDALVAWEREGRCCSVEAAFRPADGRWSKPRVLSDTYASSEDQQVAIDGRGDAVVVWLAQRGSRQFIESASRSADGRWTARRLAEAPIIDETLDAGMDERGDTIVAWHEQALEGNGSAIWTRMRPAGRDWGRARAIPGADGWPSLAVNARGDALLAWQQEGEVKVTSRPTGRSWRRPSTVSAHERPKWATDGGLAALDARGDALVTWQHREEGIRTTWRSSLFP